MPKGGNIGINKNKIKIKGQIRLSGILFSLAFLILGLATWPLGARAANPAYGAEIVSRSHSVINLLPGKAITFEAFFKNISTATWYNNSRNYISLYADASGKMFRHIYWFKAEQPARLIETAIRPGETGRLRFALQAPEVLGLYKARFKLAAEDLTWITGGILEISINVTNNPDTISDTTQPTVNSTVPSADGFGALKLIQSHTSLLLQAGQRVNFQVGFKNTGSKNWENAGVNTVKICLSENTTTDAFRIASWSETNCPAVVSSSTAPNQIGYFSVPFQGNLAGNYNLNLSLMNDDKVVDGGEVSIPIQVLGYVGAPPDPAVPAPLPNPEPTMRAGLFSTINEVSLKANTNFEIRDGNGNLVASVTAEKVIYASFNFSTKVYAVNINGQLYGNLPYLRFVGPDINTIFEITNFENRPSWNTSYNDNKFRGILELRYSEERDKLYVINELPLETYLKGLAETSNGLPYEFQKALVVAARTYAQYNLDVGGKHPAAYFVLNASAYDQVYRGYGSEVRLDDVVRAVEETRGMMVTYNGEVVVTPYFSQSDGRTRAWEEVWFGGGKPWLVSKPDPYCSGLSLWGHGVGLSARGALGMASAGNNFEQILKYYYTGIELKKFY